MRLAADRDPRARGFTLVELLVVIGIIAVLASILIPAIRAVSREARVTDTQGLLNRISIALDLYFREATYYPPDFIPDTEQIISPTGQPGFSLSGIGPAYPPEALYYYLCNRFLSNEHPLLPQRQRLEVTDHNRNQLPELCDAWARPLLYNRPRFPGFEMSYFNFAQYVGQPSGVDVKDNPVHNVDKYALYSVGPDGNTGNDDLPGITATTLGFFCGKAMDDDEDGNKEDDIRNWK